MNDPHHRRWADPKKFVAACVRPSPHPTGDTAEETIYALYRRWAWKRDQQPVSFQKLLHQVVRAVPEAREPTMASGPLRAVVVVDDLAHVPPADRPASPQPPTVQGLVRVTRPLTFCDGVIEAGSELEHMVPTPYERRELKAENERQGPGDRATWLVVRWRGRRVRIPGDAVRRLQ